MTSGTTKPPANSSNENNVLDLIVIVSEKLNWTKVEKLEIGTFCSRILVTVLVGNIFCKAQIGSRCCWNLSPISCFMNTFSFCCFQRKIALNVIWNSYLSTYVRNCDMYFLVFIMKGLFYKNWMEQYYVDMWPQRHLTSIFYNILY